ncbi:MAG: FecR domain-containing protein [Chloroflexota bacterium]
MTRNPQRMAWTVLLLAFATFCLIVVAVPLGIRWYIFGAKAERQARVEALAGTVVIEMPVGRGAVPLSRGQSLSVASGTVVRTDESAEATITFFDHSFMRLFPGTVVRLAAMHAPRYRASQRPSAIRLALLGGRLRVGTALAGPQGLDCAVETLQAEVGLEADGSYALASTNDRTEVAVYRGQALVAASGAVQPLGARERTVVRLGQPPEAAMGVARNLLENGDLSQALDVGWRAFNDQGADGGEVHGSAELLIDEGRRAVRFLRVGGDGNHCETILEQALNQQLPDPASSLVVRALVKVRYQSLAGGGYLSSEYPLMIRLTYRDVYDSEAGWVQGFYVRDGLGAPTTHGTLIPRDRWYLFESNNLLETLPVRPYKIMRLRVYASGWDYDSLASDINLIVE